MALPPGCYLFFYGSPTPYLRNLLWQYLNQEVLSLTEPWLIVGDFNSVLSSDEVSTAGRLDQRRCNAFGNWVFAHGLIYLEYSGLHFTWTCGTSNSTFRGARLDRALRNLGWNMTFQSAKVSHVPKIYSDHCPLFIQTQSKLSVAFCQISHPTSVRRGICFPFVSYKRPPPPLL